MEREFENKRLKISFISLLILLIPIIASLIFSYLSDSLRILLFILLPILGINVILCFVYSILYLKRHGKSTFAIIVLILTGLGILPLIYLAILSFIWNFNFIGLIIGIVLIFLIFLIILKLSKQTT